MPQWQMVGKTRGVRESKWPSMPSGNGRLWGACGVTAGGVGRGTAQHHGLRLDRGDDRGALCETPPHYPRDPLASTSSAPNEALLCLLGISNTSRRSPVCCRGCVFAVWYRSRSFGPACDIGGDLISKKPSLSTEHRYRDHGMVRHIRYFSSRSLEALEDHHAF